MILSSHNDERIYTVSTIVTESISVQDLKFHHSLYRLSVGDGNARRVASIERKRVNAVITLEDGYTETVRLDQPLVWERDVPTEEERAAEQTQRRLEHLRRFVAARRVRWDDTKTRLAAAMNEGPGFVTSFNLEELVTSTVNARIAQHVANMLDREGTDVEKLDRVVSVALRHLAHFTVPGSTSTQSNELALAEHEVWARIYDDMTGGMV